MEISRALRMEQEISVREGVLRNGRSLTGNRTKLLLDTLEDAFC